MPEPTIVQKRAIDVTPYVHGIYCSIEGGKPFVNEIVTRKWSEDGARISFMLESHNFMSAAPDDRIDVVEIVPGCSAEFLARVLEKDAAKMAKRPVAKPSSEALRDAEALERLFCRMTEAEKAEAAGVVVKRAIVAAREGR